MAHTSARRIGAGFAALASAIALAAPAGARAHGPASESELLSFDRETRLRQIERATLGDAHAAEHAAQRAHVRSAVLAARSGKLRSTRPVVRRYRLKRANDVNVGAWGSPFPIPVMGINTVMLPTGKVLLFSYPRNPNPAKNPPNTIVPNEALAYVWDPSKGTGTDSFKAVLPPTDPDTGRPANIWCAGQTLLADGRVLVVGGNAAYEGTPGNPEAFKGLDRVYIFDSFAETWQEQPRMNDGRWYPTLVRLADNRVLITGGLDKSGLYASPFNRDVEIFTPSAVPAVPGTVGLVGKRQSGPVGGNTPPNGGLYPHQFLLPDGRVITMGPFVEDSWFFTNPGNSMAWSDLPQLPQRRMWASAVLLPDGVQGSSKVLIMGGSNTAPPPAPPNETALATKSTLALDASLPAPTWATSTEMNVGRGHSQAVILPDASIAAVGGGYGTQGGDLWAAGPEHKPIEIRDPDTGVWKPGAAQAESRAYHSTAILLPDGRILSAGDDANDGVDADLFPDIDKDTAEIYAPPYLFKGPRPVISSVPSAMKYGAKIRVTATGDIAKAVLIAPGSVTHALDMNQRYVPVAMNSIATGVEITTPSNLNAAPPGYYMLFLVSSQGVPSIARFVKLDPNAPDQPPPDQPPAVPPAQPPPVLPPGAPTSPGPPPPPTVVTAGFKARIVAPRRVAIGRRFTLTVSLDAKVPKTKAILQRKVGARFQTLDTKSFTGRGVRFVVKLARPGTAVMRVVVGRPGIVPQRATTRIVLTPPTT